MSNLKLKSTAFRDLSDMLDSKADWHPVTIGYHTTAHRATGGSIVIEFHGNAIARFSPDGSTLTLTNAGWGTPTTRNRLGIIARANGLRVGFGQRKGEQVIIMDDAGPFDFPATYPWSGTSTFALVA